jgi:hypothetical protein
MTTKLRGAPKHVTEAANQGLKAKAKRKLFGLSSADVGRMIGFDGVRLSRAESGLRVVGAYGILNRALHFLKVLEQKHGVRPLKAVKKTQLTVVAKAMVERVFISGADVVTVPVEDVEVIVTRETGAEVFVVNELAMLLAAYCARTKTTQGEMYNVALNNGIVTFTRSANFAPIAWEVLP